MVQSLVNAWEQGLCFTDQDSDGVGCLIGSVYGLFEAREQIAAGCADILFGTGGV